MKNATIAQVKKLMLAATLNRVDPRATQRARARRRETTRERRMEDGNSTDRFADNGGAQSADSTLDFRKLGHDISSFAVDRKFQPW
jgi:hypothetical protein